MQLAKIGKAYFFIKKRLLQTNFHVTISQLPPFAVIVKLITQHNAGYQKGKWCIFFCDHVVLHIIRLPELP